MKGYLNSGDTYSLENIFVNEINGKVVIPDLQRDYCWGGKGSLVTDFVTSIKERFEDDGKLDLMMGLLYGYYEENRPNLQLCDGQQRLTTLYLLIGYINRVCGRNSFRSFLISDYEIEEDDKEPNLLYDIRDSSLYFLSDLVCNFFIQKGAETVDGSLSEYIRKQEWWFKTYETDPTILSILAAMDEIQKVLQDKPYLEDFGHYVCQKLHFVFFNMGDRKNGEEAFVIINTTGEPLTAAENLKPLVVTKKSSSEEEWEQNSRQWEEVEHWFWLHRDKSSEDTSDAGMNEFLRWVAAIHVYRCFKKEDYYPLLSNRNYVFPYHEIGIKEIKDTFDALRRLNNDSEFISISDLLSAPKGGMYDLKEYFYILPTLKHFMVFGDKDASVRIYRFFRNLSRYTEISTGNNNVILALETIDHMKEVGMADVCSLLELESKLSTAYILTEEEKTRLTIIRSRAEDKEWRKEVEEAFEEASTHNVLSGRIGCLVACSVGNAHRFDFKIFKANVRRFESLFHRENKNVVDDKTVLAFAAFCQEKGCDVYPVANGNYRDFGYYAAEWNRFIYGDKYHVLLFGDFLQEIDEKDINEAEDRIINSCDNPMFHLIKENIPLAFKGEWHKRLSIHPVSGLIRLFYNASYRSDKDVYLLGKEIILACCFSEKWNCWNFYEYGEEYCLYTDHKDYDVAMDLLFAKVSDNQYRLRIFKRGDKTKKNLDGLESLLVKFSLEIENGRMVSKDMSAKEIIGFIGEMKDIIEKVTKCDNILNAFV